MNRTKAISNQLQMNIKRFAIVEFNTQNPAVKQRRESNLNRSFHTTTATTTASCPDRDKRRSMMKREGKKIFLKSQMRDYSMRISMEELWLKAPMDA
jgi:hypothetical protein